MTPQEYYAERSEAGKRLDPETVKYVFGRHVYVIDPYGVYDDLSPEEECFGRLTFTFSTEEGEILFDHLPAETRRKLHERIKSGAFDAEELDLPF